jgi:hypothetical protein
LRVIYIKMEVYLLHLDGLQMTKIIFTEKLVMLVLVQLLLQKNYIFKVI